MMKRRSTQQGLDTTTSLKHGRRTAALMLIISALGGQRAAPPEVRRALGRAKASHTQAVSGCAAPAREGGTAGHAYMHTGKH